jgi:HAMP domain-containing protein
MKRKAGKEMRNLILAVSVSTTLLVIAIIAYFMVSIIVTTNNNIDNNKNRMVEESVRTLQDMGEIASMTNMDAGIIKLLNQDIVNKILEGEMESLYETGVDILISFYPVDYASIIIDNDIVSYRTQNNEAVDLVEMPNEPPEEDYETLDSLGDKEGFFVSVFIPFDLAYVGFEGEIYINLVIERTEELAEIEEYFTEQRNDLVVQMSIAAIIALILTLLLTTLGLRYFTNKYVARPIEELNRTAEEIADGTFEGDVEVDEDSAYAALQGLLRSGQKVLSRMDEELRE